MLTSPAQVSHMGRCMDLTKKSPPLYLLQTTRSLPPCLPASAMALLVEVPQNLFLTYNILPQQSSLPPTHPHISFCEQSTVPAPQSTWLSQPSLPKPSELASSSVCPLGAQALDLCARLGLYPSTLPGSKHIHTFPSPVPQHSCTSMLA